MDKHSRLFRIILPLLAILLFSFSYAAYADELGCCINPGAGTFACSGERLVLKENECCPVAESDNPDFYKPQNPAAPLNSNECKSRFFISGASLNTCFDVIFLINRITCPPEYFGKNLAIIWT